MSKSLIIVALALGGLHDGVFAQTPPFVSDNSITEDVPNIILLASEGNPWALPEPDADYGYPEPMRTQPTPRVERPRYITPEELNKLGRLPEENNYYAPGRIPLNREGRYRGMPYSGPAVPGGSRYYGQGAYPSGSYYGSPYGSSPLYDPYGGSNSLPYGGGILPFLY